MAREVMFLESTCRLGGGENFNLTDWLSGKQGRVSFHPSASRYWEPQLQLTDSP